MRKYLLLLFAAIFISQSSEAAVGDTTWVQANNVQMANTANYDTAITFPNGSVTYKKILMVFTLGKYSCPAGSQYCGSWDYIVGNYIMTPGGDTMEISRLITPYATTSTYFPLTWTYNYVFDVTDYAAYLKNSATVRVAYGGYSYGFSANVRFAFIEGTPDRNVIGVQRLWHGQFQYGVATDPIANHLGAITETVPTGTVSSEMKMRITGHGEDGNNCNEFCPNTYDVLLNGTDIATQDFWRTTCGLNPIYAQTGTWVYNRANWCPGALVNDIYNPLSATSGSYSVGVTFPAYTTVSSSSGNSTPTYDIEAAAVYYGAINKTLDASLEEVLSPNSDPNYLRGNTICDQPTIHVHNSGSTAITSLNIAYGITGGVIYNYTWNGSLAALHDTDVVMPGFNELQANDGLTTVMYFTAKITQVNGGTDDDTTNNTLNTTFKPAPLWQSNSFVIKMKTSNYANGTASTESWQILDMVGNVIASRSGNAKTLYTDTVSLANACYKLVVTAPDGYGLLFGNYYSGTASDNGNLTVNKLGSSAVAIPNYRGGDFGSGFTQYFSSSVFPAGVVSTIVGTEALEAYPNPAQNILNIDISGMQQVQGTVTIIDALGRTVSETACTAAHQQVNVSQLANGVYTIVFTDSKQGKNKLTTRLLIAK